MDTQNRVDKPPSNPPTGRGHSGVCAETVRLDDDGDAAPDGVKMERVWQRMVGAQSEQDEREASRIHDWNRKGCILCKKSPVAKRHAFPAKTEIIH